MCGRGGGGRPERQTPGRAHEDIKSAGARNIGRRSHTNGKERWQFVITDQIKPQISDRQTEAYRRTYEDMECAGARNTGRRPDVNEGRIVHFCYN